MELEQAIAIVKAAGYRVTKARAVQQRPTLNALGKPYSANYDPNYKMKYRTPHIKREQDLSDCTLSAATWAKMCANAKAHWAYSLKHGTPLPHDLGRAPLPEECDAQA